MTDFIDNMNFKGKKVIIRCDLNVPIKDKKIEDETRIIESINTINYVLKTAERVVILSHLGRIKNEEDKKNKSLRIVCNRLSELLKRKVKFVTYDEDIKKCINDNKIIMLENTRFFDLDNKSESNNNIKLAKYFSSFGDIFINDAFGTCHRKNASNYGISKYLPSYLGFLVKKEIKMLNQIKNNPKRPLLVIMGGSKVTDKILLIKKMVKKADKIIISGAMAFSFLKVKGYEIGNSIIDENSFDFIKEILSQYNDKIILPIDVYTGLDFKNNTKKSLRSINDINKNEIGLDIGEETLKIYFNEISKSNTIFFNGPVGAFELDNYSNGTKALLNNLSNSGKVVIIGGGDSVHAVKKFNYNFNNISTGGGAALEYIEGKKLPGLYLGGSNEEV